MEKQKWEHNRGGNYICEKHQHKRKQDNRRTQKKENNHQNHVIAPKLY